LNRESIEEEIKELEVIENNGEAPSLFGFI